MKNRYIIIIIFILSNSLASIAQDTIYFSNEYKNISEGHGMAVLYKLEGDSVRYRGVSKKIILPDLSDTSQIAFFMDYFTGWEPMPYDRVPSFLVRGYGDFNCDVYVDYNHNLDFSDDGEPLNLKNKEDSVHVFFSNKNNPNAFFVLGFKFANYINEDSRQLCENFFGKHSNGKGNKALGSDYWFRVNRYNSRITETIINKEKVLIGIHDYDCNALYNDKKDRVMIGDVTTGKIDSKLNRGGYEYKDTCIVKINGINYLVNDIEESGKYLVIQKTDLPLNRLVIGDKLPNFKFTLLNDSSAHLYDFMDSNKYTIIDVWGSWCAGCKMQIPHLVEIDSLYTDIVQIIALNYGDNSETIHSLIKENRVKYINGYVSKEIMEELMVDGYPYLLLVDKQKRIKLPQARLYEIKKEILNVEEGE
jgi:thiol-disulfide isomerase/thioredoxin